MEIVAMVVCLVCAGWTTFCLLRLKDGENRARALPGPEFGYPEFTGSYRTPAVVPELPSGDPEEASFIGFTQDGILCARDHYGKEWRRDPMRHRWIDPDGNEPPDKKLKAALDRVLETKSAELTAKRLFSSKLE